MSDNTESLKALHLSECSTKPISRVRQHAKWESLKEEIRRLYVDQDMTLKATMHSMENKYKFKASLRTWKSKVKEWNLQKNLPANEMSFIAAKADKRKADDGKDTVFVRGGVKIGTERIENFKKRKLTALDMADLPILVDTPSNVTYHTPPAETELLEPNHSLVIQDHDEIGFGNYREHMEGSLHENQEHLPSIGLKASESGKSTSTFDDASIASRLECPANAPDILHPLGIYNLAGQESLERPQFHDSNVNSPLFSARHIIEIARGNPSWNINFKFVVAIGESFLALSIFDDCDVIRLKEHRGSSFEFDDEFYQVDLRSINSGISAVTNSYDREEDLWEPAYGPATVSKFDSEVLSARHKLLLLLHNIKESSDRHTMSTLASAATELIHVALAILRLTYNDPSCRIVIKRAIPWLSHHMLFSWQDEERCDHLHDSLAWARTGLDEIETIADSFCRTELLKNAELVYRFLIAIIQPRDNHKILRLQTSLFKILYKTSLDEEFHGELARLSLINLMWTLEIHYTYNTTSPSIRLAAVMFHEVWDRYPIQEDGIDVVGDVWQQVKLLSQRLQTILKTDDVESKMFSELMLLCHLCSELGWHDIANQMFKVLLRHLRRTCYDRDSNGSRRALTRRAYGHAWHALSLQRQHDWPDSVEALRKGYNVLSSLLRLTTSTNSLECREILSLLRSSLECVPESLVGDVSMLNLLHENVNKSLRIAPNSSTMTTLSCSSPKILRRSSFASTTAVSSILGTSPLIAGSISTGRHGVTYSESVVSGVSLNYSALFPGGY